MEVLQAVLKSLNSGLCIAAADGEGAFVRVSDVEIGVEGATRSPTPATTTRRIQDWLGHRSIQHTTRYAQLTAAPFEDFWR
jgi:hypothetical protein